MDNVVKFVKRDTTPYEGRQHTVVDFRKWQIKKITNIYGLEFVREKEDPGLKGDETKELW